MSNRLTYPLGGKSQGQLQNRKLNASNKKIPSSKSEGKGNKMLPQPVGNAAGRGNEHGEGFTHIRNFSNGRRSDTYSTRA